MLKSNRQTEWIEKKGIFLWLAFYFGGLGGGLFLFSLLFNNIWGMLAGWAIVAVLKGSSHMIDLGKPSRFWRLVFNARASWLSRGLIFVIAFIAVGFIQMLVTYFFPGSVTEMILKIVSGSLSILVMGYTGLVLSKVKGVPLWKFPFLPLLFISCGLLSGFGVTQGISLISGSVNLEFLVMVSRLLLTFTALLLATYLIIIWQKRDDELNSEFYRIKKGVSTVLLTLVVILGILLPLAIAINSLFVSGTNNFILISAIASEILSGTIVDYYLLKSGVYNPILISRQPEKYKLFPIQMATVGRKQPAAE